MRFPTSAFSSLYVALACAVVVLLSNGSVLSVRAQLDPNVNPDLFYPYNHTEGLLSWFESDTFGSLSPAISVDYVLQIAIPGIVLIAIGVIAFFTFLIWSCCGCGCCPCCKTDDEIDCCCCSTKTAKYVYVLLALLTAGAVVGCGAYGLSVDEGQEEAFNALVPAGNALGNWTNQLSRDINEQSALITSIRDTINKPNLNVQKETEVNAFIAVLDATLAALDGLAFGVNAMSLGTFTVKFEELIKPVNEYRQIALLAGLGVLLGIVLIQISLSFMNLFCNDSCKPNECCGGQIIQGTVSAVFLLAFLIIWIVFGILVSVTAVPADICKSPIGVIGLTGVGDQFKFFIECGDYNASAQVSQNPFASEISTLQDSVQLINTAWQVVTDAADPAGCTDTSGGKETCADQEAAATALINQLTFDEIVSYASCSSLNSLWNVIANTLCGTVGDSLAETTLLVGAISFIMLIAEPVRRKLNAIYLEEQDGGKTV